MTIIAISGSQGTGKSTLINALTEQLNIPAVVRKTSRSILSDWGVSLNEVNANMDLCKRFQDEILKRKLYDDTEAAKNSPVVITERTFADLFTYSVITLGSNNKNEEWLDGYLEQCRDAQKIYDTVVYLPRGRFEIEPDGVRSTNQYFSRLVDGMLVDCTSDFSPGRVVTLEAVDINERVRVFKEIIGHSN